MKRKWEERVKKVEELASHYERNPLPTVYRPRLSKPFQPSSIWKIFSRQAEAFRFVTTCKEDVHVFALERNTQNGQRFYLVTSYKEIWHYYTQGCKTSLMHCYEVIPEKDACKLYFDLEFYKAANPGADGKDMVAKLIKLVSQKLKELYDVNCSASDVLNLDSSTDEKFSRHLIFLPCKTVFKDNIHVGHFVRTILQPAIRLMESHITAGGVGHTSQSSAPTVELDGSLRNLTAVKDASTADQANKTETSHHGESSEFSFLIVNNKEGDKQLFVDLGKNICFPVGVYTKNRNFRMYKSSKAGKNVTLKIAEDNKFVPNCEENMSLEEAYFLSSLVCNSMEGYQDSPYPEIDSFVRSLINKDGVQGGKDCAIIHRRISSSSIFKQFSFSGIRQWNYFSGEEILVYDISGYRWCENIGRPHRSNNIMILVDLKKEVWYQKCHDPVCREKNFKSQSLPLPPRICLSSLFVEEEENTVMEEHENTEEKVTSHSNPADLSESSASLEKNMSRDTQWDNASDDAYLAETTEDVELAEAANDSLGYDVEEIPDEVLLEVSWE
ncbi:PRIPO protein, partial [Odontophorus gujanensis]|nr:PRIPO protein [Odontophorus gujanensis]